MSKSFSVSADGIHGSFLASFKTLRESKAISLGIPDKAGKKRPSFKPAFELVTAQNTSISDDVCLVLNEALVGYGKSLVSDNETDWSYSPTAQEITLASLAESIRKPSLRGQRTLTIANIKVWAAWISTQFIETLGKSQGFSVTVVTLAEQKFSRLVGMPEKIQSVLNAMTDDRLMDKLGELDDSEQSGLILDVHQALVEKLDDVGNASIQEISLDSLE